MIPPASGEFALALPGPLDRRTGGTIYDRRLVEALADVGIRGRVVNLAEGFPFPTPAEAEAAASALLALPKELPLVVDGLALGALPGLAPRLAARGPLIALVHHPLALETGLDPAQAGRLQASERAALAHARRVLVTSPLTARLLAADYAVPHERLVVAPPGVDPRPVARGPAPGDPPLILNVGSVVARKDQAGLVQALRPLLDLPWRLAVAGSLARDPKAVLALRAAIAPDMAPRVELLGELDDAALLALFERASLLVSAARFEGYGMAIAEAVAAGLPVVAVAGGAVAETLPEGAGLLVPPDRPEALTAALRSVLADPAPLRAGALRARGHLPRWADAARTVAALLAGLKDHPR